MDKLKVLSMGWGVQSFTLAAMVAYGDLEPIDFAIHADTTHERDETYRIIEMWTPWLERRGVRVLQVCAPDAGRLYEDRTNIPAFTKTEGGAGMLKRQCTNNWKIRPLRKEIRKQMRAKGIKVKEEVVELWLGISLDEYKRMKPSNVAYIKNRWPLVEMRMTRKDCRSYLVEKGLEIPPRSSCVFCPYHDIEEWKSIKNIPKDWGAAVEMDKKIRGVRLPGELYLHKELIPLDQVEFVDNYSGQISLWEQECEGVCGV